MKWPGLSLYSQDREKQPSVSCFADNRNERAKKAGVFLVLSMENKMKIALIGLGQIAQKAYLPILANHTKVAPVLCTRNPKTLAALAQKYRIRDTYTDLEQLIRSKPDAAMVHSATESHAGIALQLLKAEIPVFVDKPLSYSLEETNRVLECAFLNKTPLYMGFNRRFAPMISALSEVPNPRQITWDKNRVHLPSAPRVFIFDDFIHVIDSLRFLGKGKVRHLQVFASLYEGMMENIQVRWQQGDTLLSGGMNRISGITEERVELYSRGNKWTVYDLSYGTHCAKEQASAMTSGSWDTTLYKRGFVNMVEDWLHVAQSRTVSAPSLEDIRATHQLCEAILGKALEGTKI